MIGVVINLLWVIIKGERGVFWRDKLIFVNCIFFSRCFCSVGTTGTISCARNPLSTYILYS